MSLSYFNMINGGSSELWVRDSVAHTTHLVRPIGPNPFNEILTIGAQVYFTADDGVHGTELWTSDGTAAGTVVIDIAPGGAASFPTTLTNVNGTLFFTANDGVHGRELWKSDGTAAGTTMVADIVPGASGSGPLELTNVNGTLFFSANDGVNGDELWKSDGTAAGTTLVKNINPTGDSNPIDLTNVNGTLFFQASDAVNGRELWKSDGTATGTVMVKDINAGAGSSVPLNLTNVNGTAFFQADNGTGFELWKSDGTAAGTVMVKDINPFGSSGLTSLANVNGTLFFSATDGVNGLELWKSDGTAAGTVMVKDIFAGATSSAPGFFANVNGTLFFAATDPVNGRELWKSDGTAAGTVLVKDIVAGVGDSSPNNLKNVNGVLEFYAFDGTGFGLFRSDGTAAGTTELATNVSQIPAIGFAPAALPNDVNGDGMSDVLWRNSGAGVASWSMNGGTIASSGLLNFGGAAVVPDASWSVAGISDFNGDGRSDMLWRNTDGSLAEWTLNGSTITSSAALTSGGIAIKPDASWNIAGVGDLNGDTRSDILWRNTDGTLIDWTMDGSVISSSSVVTSNGVAVKPDASWSIIGIGDGNGDQRRDILWRNTTTGELVGWSMRGSSIAFSADLTSGGVPVAPDASWNVAGIGDFNGDGTADILWRHSDGSLAVWLMNGAAITSGTVTAGGAAVTPDASWHVVEIGDFNGDGNSDILWRNDNGAMAEWLMNGSTIAQSVTPTTGALPISPDASWSTQAKPTNFG